MTRVRIGPTSALSAGEILGVCHEGRRFAIYNVDGSFFATDDECTHGKSSLSEEGMLEGEEIVCGWHGGRFCVKKGDAVGFPAMTPLRTYPVVREGDDIFIEVDP